MINKELQQLPVVNAVKVRAIKKKIAKGEYDIDAQSIAEKLIEMDELLVTYTI